jgi:hypothetical protein
MSVFSTKIRAIWTIPGPPILSILMFHLTLVHVPGAHHGPDGLSQQRRQPRDEDEPEDDFEDWINNVNGFMHYQTNTISDSPPVTIFMTESV